jgi:ABC-type branched-subunit amino acid transport system substrate-binding protein
MLLGCCSLLAGCSTAMGPKELPTASLPPGTQYAQSARAPVKIALLLPLAGMDERSALAKSMKQAAELALFEANDPSIQLITKDDGGTPSGAKAAAEAATAEGAEIILGPLQAQSVAGAAPVARKAAVPMLAFSNDAKVAGNGVYLVSYLPEQEVDRIIQFASNRGKRRYAALIPQGPYGDVVEGAFRRAVAATRGTVSVIERYPPDANGMLVPTQRLAEEIKRGEDELAPVDALFLPGGREVLPQLAPQLAYSGLDFKKIQMLGTSAWDYPSIGRDDAFVGGWYPSPDPLAWRGFAERYTKTFGTSPPRLASVAYDSLNMAIQLATNAAGARYTPEAITRPQGFSGVDGMVRLNANGLSDRGLAVLEVQKFSATVLDPAPNALGQTKVSDAAGPPVPAR